MRLSIAIFLFNLVRSIRHGERAEGNLWNSRSPEWQVPSPMPVHNYERPLEVVGEPYDYGLAGSQYTSFASEHEAKGSHTHETSGQASLLQQGAVVFVFLAVLTALEFFIAVAVGSVVLLVVVALIKVALVMYYYMHIYKLNQDCGDDQHVA